MHNKVFKRLMQFEGRSYWEQIDMVCDELKKAGFIEKRVKCKKRSENIYYYKDDCDMVLAVINLPDREQLIRTKDKKVGRVGDGLKQAVVIDKSVFNSLMENRKKLSLKVRSDTLNEVVADATGKRYVAIVTNSGNECLHQYVMGYPYVHKDAQIDHLSHYMGICTKDFLRVCSPQQNRCNMACYSKIDRENKQFIISCTQMDSAQRLVYIMKGYSFKNNRMHSPSFNTYEEMHQALDEFENSYLGKYRYSPLYDFYDTFYAFVAWKMLGWGTETEITEYNRDYIMRNNPEVAEYYRLGA